MNIYELYGRLAEERQTEHDQHLRTIALLAEIKTGKRKIEDIEVFADGWRIVEAKPEA